MLMSQEVNLTSLFSPFSLYASGEDRAITQDALCMEERTANIFSSECFLLIVN